MARYKLIFGLLLFLAALALRTCGLSHDLHLGRIYHPDTPKQIRAIERFLDGDYYTLLGGPDYEGYPLFNSHMVEYGIRAYQAVGGFVVRHTGWGESVARPERMTLYAITRFFNATYSALAVLLVFLIGWRWLAPAAGGVAALLLALSPADLIACHYANGDSAAAFFALCSLYFALRLLHKPTLLGYLAAGLLAAAAFSSKYHGGIALGTVGLAHLLHYAQRRRLFSATSISYGLLLVVIFIGGLFLTSPALIAYPESAFKDIVAFFKHTASFGMTAEMRALSTGQRFITGMSVNMPVLADVVGIVPAFAALAAVVVGRRRAVIWVIAATPLAYILAGLSTKPLAHVVYHTMATPGIMLLAAFALHQLAASGAALRIPRRAFATLLLLIAVSHLGRHAHRELFFFRHNATNHLAVSWAIDNIPRPFTLTTSSYTFHPKFWADRAAPATHPDVTGSLYVFSGRTGIHPPPDALPVHTFRLEDPRLYPFRNWPQHLFLADAPAIDPLGPRPGFQPMPSPQPANLIDADAPWWVRHTATHTLSDRDDPLRRTLVSTQRLASAAWLVHAGPEPAHLLLTFGRRHHNVRLEPGASIILPIEHPRPHRIFRSSRFFYAVAGRAKFGRARVTLLTAPRDHAWALFNLGHFAEALTTLPDEPATTPTRGDRILREVALLASEGSAPANPVDSSTPLTTREESGLASTYLDHLHGLAWEPKEWTVYSKPDANPDEPGTLELHLPPCSLEPGCYTLGLEGLDPALTAKLQVRDDLERLLETHDLLPPATPDKPHHASFSVAPGDGWVHLRISVPALADATPPSLTAVTVRPDLEGTLNSYRRLLAFMRDSTTEPTDAHRFWYGPLLRYGEGQLRTGDAAKAQRLFEAATRIAPTQAGALQARLALPDGHEQLALDLQPLVARHEAQRAFRDVQPIAARFQGGAVLRGYQLTSRQVKAGTSFGLRTHWAPKTLARRVRRQAVWLHAVPEGGHDPAFQGDQNMIELLRMSRPGEERIDPSYLEIQVPADTPPGRYQLKTGVWIPIQKKRLKVLEADTPHERRSVILATIDVVK